MIILGITTSGPVEAAVAGGSRQAAVAGKGQALASLLDCISEVLAQSEIALANINAVAVCVGPGSFTGLRIGVAFAKALAQARDLPCIAISAYDVAEAGSRAMFPRAAIVAGKPGYYYARLRDASDAAPRFARGSGEEISEAIEELARAAGRPVALHGECSAVPSRRASIVAGAYASRAAGERARSVAQLAAARPVDGVAADWRRIVIDYGQRPNAVINWESRRSSP